jgi:hypothetical protein
MSEKECEPGYNNQMKIECGEELKRILLEQGIKQVIEQELNISKDNGAFIKKDSDKYYIYIPGQLNIIILKKRLRNF